MNLIKQFVLLSTALLTASLSILLGNIYAPAAAATSNALSLKMTAGTSSRVSLGEPIVIHYKIENTSAQGQITYHAGVNNNEWYRISLKDADGHVTESVPPPQLGSVEGLHQSPEVSILHGSYFEHDIVVTRYLKPPHPGNYTLTVYAKLPYHVEPEGAWFPLGHPSDMPQTDFAQGYSFLLTVTPADPAALRATAEVLHRKLLDVRCDGQWESLTGQLFAMPEANVLPVWQDLLTDPKTDDLVLRNAADQLASQPSPVHADLLAEALWEGTKPMDTFAHPWVSRTLFKMYETATGPLKEHIRSLYTAHGDAGIVEIEEMKAKRPN